MRKVFGLALLILPLMGWAQGPFDGTWKVNLGSAKLTEKPDIQTLQGGRYECKTCSPAFSVKADGSDQKVSGATSYDTIAVKQVDENTLQYTRKKTGKKVQEATDVVSEDGQSMTTEWKVYPIQGEPATGKVTFTRVEPAPTGAHKASGAWRVNKVENLSENAALVTFKSSAHGLAMTAPTGENYDAKFDGKDYPVKNDLSGSTVSLKKISDNNIIETIKQNGKVVYTNNMTVSGDTIKVVSQDARKGTTDEYTLDKQ